MSENATLFGPESTTEEVLTGIDLAGKRALVTGASGGLGRETARALAARGAGLVLAARDLPKAEAAAAEIRTATGNPDVSVTQLDLGSRKSIRACAERLLARSEPLSLLINNAGVMGCPFGKTEDGFEQQFGTNHLGHFLFTNLLVPALVAGASGRVVNLSSGGHKFSDVLWDDPNFAETPYDKFVSYGQSKTANVLFSVELDARLQGRGVRSFAVHPGAIATELGRHLVREDVEHMTKNRPGKKFAMKSLEVGAATSCYAATSPDLEGRGGLYLEDCGVAEVNDGPGQTGVRSYALDPEHAKRLWSLSEELLGERFAP